MQLSPEQQHDAGLSEHMLTSIVLDMREKFGQEAVKAALESAFRFGKMTLEISDYAPGRS